jgi:hypothetical protein
VPSRNESTDSALNVKYCVWVMERCVSLCCRSSPSALLKADNPPRLALSVRSIDMMPPGVEKQVLLVRCVLLSRSLVALRALTFMSCRLTVSLVACLLPRSRQSVAGSTCSRITILNGWERCALPLAPKDVFLEGLTGLPVFNSSQAIAIKVPWILNQFFKIILPLIDPVTRAKLSFNEPAVRPSRLTLCVVPQSRVADVLRLVVSQPWVPDNQLQTDFGGKYNFEFDQEGYLPSLLELCSRRRAEYRKRWEEDGSRVGAPVPAVSARRSDLVLTPPPPLSADRSFGVDLARWTSRRV